MPHARSTITVNGGPLLDFLIGVSQFHADALKTDKKPVPPPVKVRGLIDTGASCTLIDPTILAPLDLTATGTIPIHTPSTAGEPRVCLQYDVSVILPLANDYSYTIFALPIVESQLLAQGIGALLGRDILARGLFIYDGFAQSFTLGF